MFMPILIEGGYQPTLAYERMLKRTSNGLIREALRVRRRYHRGRLALVRLSTSRRRRPRQVPCSDLSLAKCRGNSDPSAKFRMRTVAHLVISNRFVLSVFFSYRKRRFSPCHIHVTLLKMDEHLLKIAPIISCRIARKIDQNGAFESTSRQRLVNNVLLWWRGEHMRGTLIKKMIVIMTIMTIIMSVTMPSKAGCCCSTTFVMSLHAGRIQFEASSYHKQMA